MLKKIANKLSHNYIEKCENEIFELNYQLFEQKNEIQNLKHRFEKLEEIIFKLSHNPNLEIVGAEKDKRGYLVLVVKQELPKNVHFFLYGVDYTPLSRPRIYTEKILPDEDYKSNIIPHLYIEDFMAVVENVGNGKILINYLIDYAKENHYSYICGWLSGVDSNHFDKLEYFYRQCGFQVTFNSKKTSGNIVLYL